MSFVKCIRLNESGNPSGEVHLVPEQIVAIVGDETAPSVRVLTTAGVEYHLQQPSEPPAEGEEAASVLSQFGGGMSPSERRRAAKEEAAKEKAAEHPPEPDPQSRRHGKE